MCGIAGFAGLQDRELLEAMTETLRHRGPDDVGFLHEGGVGLGSRRLAIIDLQAGPQPVAGCHGRVTVVFNGEIYNFQELRRELEGKGHKFKTRTDTEVIVHLYEEHGRQALERLSGMFALALWDARSRTLLLARDPLGIKPLYYAVCGRKLYFGSEIKALLKAPEVSRELDLGSLTQYFDFLYIGAPRTIYKNIRKICPGEWIVWSEGRIEAGHFWRPRIGGCALGRGEAMAKLDSLLQQVVADQMVADVPVGLFLSGGIDSSTLAYYLSRGKNRPEAFCAYFTSGGADYNENDKARAVARHFGLKLTELCMEPNVDELLDTLIESFDEPLADSSALPTYWISKLAREHVTVALTGIGGDEVFGGYPRYLGAKLLPSYQRMPGLARRMLRGAAGQAPVQISSRNVGGWIRRFLAEDRGGFEEVYSGWVGHLNASDKQAIYSPALRAALPSRSQVLSQFDLYGGQFLKRIQAVDLETYLSGDLLAHADRMSMRVGLELRVPFCDQRLVEFALSLPPEFQVEGFRLKPMLKDLLKDRVPPEIVSQKKQGFMIPLGPWFQSELKPMVERGMANLKRRGLLDPDGMDLLFNQHMTGFRNRTDVLWSWVLLDRWLERYAPDFKGDSPPRKGSRAKKVLMVSDEIFPDSGGGGLGRGAWQESLHLAERGHDVRLWTLDRKGGLPEAQIIEGLSVYRLDARHFYRHPTTLPTFLHAADRSLTELFESFRPDVVIAQSPLSAWLVQDRPEVSRARLIYRYNSSWPEEYSIDRPGFVSLPGRLYRSVIEREVINRYEIAAAISDFMNRNFGGHYGRPVTTLSAGVNFKDFTLGDRGEARRRLGVSGEPLLVTVRNLRPRMGWENLFGAAESLRGDYPGLKVVIVGSGPMEADLRREIARRKLSGIVFLAGRVEDADLPLYYQAADLFVLPTSELEGLGLVLLEALACGTRCVGTPIGGIPEVLRPIDPGWIADSATPEAFAQAIRRGLASQATPEALRRNVQARYGWTRMAEGLERLFERRPRVLHVITRLDFGGSAENVILSAEGAARAGFDAAVAAGPAQASTPGGEDITLFRLPSLIRALSPMRDLAAFIDILSILQSWRPDIVHTHSSKAGILGRWAAFFLRLTGSGPRLVVHTPHGHVYYGYFGPLKTTFFTALERATALITDRLVALTEEEKRENLERGVGAPEQWSVVPSGVDYALEGGVPRDFGFPKDALVIGCVARLDPVKGVGVLVEAAAGVLARAGRPVRFLIVGDGSQGPALKRRARELGIADSILFAGYQREPAACMKAMHVYVQPSLNEGMGKTLVQAQARGLPIAASRACGIASVVEDGRTALLVPPGDVEALAQALLRLVSDEDLRRSLGEAGRRRVSQRDETGARVFSAQSMVLRLNRLYRAALGALLIAACLAGRPADAAILHAVAHVHSTISHNGKETLAQVAERAKAKGIDVLIPTDSFTADWEYGVWPLRHLIRRKVSAKSVMSLGIAEYLRQVLALREKFPELVIIPGVEASAYYRWEGSPLRHLTINDYNRHLLIIGPEEARAYAGLPAAGNPQGGAFDWLALWPLVPLAVGAAAWTATRRRRYGAVILFSLVFLIDGWPFRRLAASPYARQTPWEPYQDLIDAARREGALVFWAHPDAPNWGGTSANERVSVNTALYPEALLRTVDFDGFAAVHEGMRRAAPAGGTWDEALSLYLKGRRAKPCWAIGELDYRDPAETRIDSAQIVIDARSRAPRDILDSLRAGRFYSIQVSDHAFALRRFTLSGGGRSAASGETLSGARKPTLDIELAYEDGAAGEASLEIISDGRVVKREDVKIPGRWSYDFEAGAPKSYYRLIARYGNNILISNPIFASAQP